MSGSRPAVPPKSHRKGRVMPWSAPHTKNAANIQTFEHFFFGTPPSAPKPHRKGRVIAPRIPPKPHGPGRVIGQCSRG